MKVTLKLFLPIAMLLISNDAKACLDCNKQVREAIFDSAFYPNLFVIILPFIIVGIVVAILAVISTKRFKARIIANEGGQLLSPVPLTSASLILGIGIGGFIDGIVFHQILQWHEMISTKVPPVNFVAKSVNMFWDGIFHAVTLIATTVGVVLLWKLLHRKDIDKSGNLFAGGMLGGWGLFNVLEGIADHHVLKLHNVREASPNPEAWNWGFLGFSVILLLVGYLLAKQRKENVQ